MRAAFDRMAAAAAHRLLAWVARWVDPARQTWLEAIRAELEVIDGGIAQLMWAVGGLRLIWFDRRQHMVNVAYRYSPILLIVLGVALFVGFTLSLMQYYVSIAEVLLVLTGLGLLVAVPALSALVHAIQTMVRTRIAARHLEHQPERRVRSSIALVVGVLSLGILLVLGLSAPVALDQVLAQGPATAGVVVSAADHHAVEAELSQTAGIPRPDAYLTTQVRPLAVNGVPLAQLLELTPQMIGTPPSNQISSLQDDLRQLVEKFTGIQGYDLAHSQFPDGVGIYPPDGSTGPGPNEILRPLGRLLDAHDANSLNVLIPLDPVAKGSGCSASYHPVNPADKYLCDDYRTYNGDTISVQSLVTGQILSLRVVGQYITDDGAAAPLFGKILADDSVVRALSGGHPSYAYGLRLDTTQRQAVFERLRRVVPTAQVYDFTTDLSGPETKPAYSRFTDLNTEEGIWSSGHLPLLGEAAISWALLAAIIIVASREAHSLLKRRRELRGDAGGGRALPHE